MKVTLSLIVFAIAFSLPALAARPRHRPKSKPTPSASPSAPEESGSPNPSPSASPNPAVAEALSLDAPNGVQLTLENSIEMAVNGASSVLRAANEYDFSGSRLLQAYGQFLPSLGATGTYQYTNGRTYSAVATPVYIDGTTKNAGYVVTADLNIFNGFSDFSNLRSSSLKRDAADLTLKRARQEIALDVAQSFLQVILDDKIVGISVQNLEASQERERLLKGQTDVGARNLADYFRQQAQTSQDEAALLSAQNKRRTDQILLLRKLRVDVGKVFHFVEPKLSDENGTSIGNEEALVTEALEKRMDLKASDETSAASRWDVHTAAGNYFPKLDLFGSVNSVGHTLDGQTVNGLNVTPPYQDSLRTQLGREVEYTVGVNLTWTLFDRFLTSQNTARARLIANNAEVDAGGRKFQVQGEVRQAYGGYQISVQQLRASKQGLEAAQKAYEVMDGRYGVGAASFLDLVTAQTVLVQAESTRIQAQVNYELQERSLRFAVGDEQIATK